jgi:hypothetical protein
MIIIKQDILRPKLSNNATQRPNIDFLIESTSQYDLWSSIRSRLDITRNIHIMREGTISQIDDSNFNWIVRLNHDIFRF